MTNGTRVGIAVLDSGIEEVTKTNPQRNPDLPPTAGGKSFVSYTRSTNDDFGHGTEVAGVIAAGDNNFGVVGIANDLMRPIHLRMPVILSPDQESLWLSGKTPVAELLAMLEPAPLEDLKAYEVSPEVNRASTDTPAVMEPV